MTDGYTLKMLRAKHDLTQNQAAAKIGVSETTWRNWEVAKTFPDALKIKKIERAFGVAYDDIIFLKENTV